MGMILHKINRPTSDVDKNAGKVLTLLRNLKRKTFGLIAIQKSVRQLLLKAEETRGSGGRGRRRGVGVKEEDVFYPWSQPY
jgi:hypothetical protein